MLMFYFYYKHNKQFYLSYWDILFELISIIIILKNKAYRLKVSKILKKDI